MDRDKVYLTFRAQIEDKFETVTVTLANPNRHQDLRIESAFPYSTFSLFIGDKKLYSTNATVVLMKLAMDGNLQGEFAKNLDLEILYIGQSYGIEGSRNAIDRLKAHSTLQAIYEQANSNNPDKDILLLLLTFNQWLLTSFNGRKKISKEEDKLDDTHLENVMQRVMNEGITEQQQINFTEATLIKYFQPPYNTIYKNSFPNPAHSTYSECYDIDINTLCLEVNTEEIFSRLYSESVPARWIHMVSFELHTRQDRMNIFRL